MKSTSIGISGEIARIRSARKTKLPRSIPTRVTPWLTQSFEIWRPSSAIRVRSSSCVIRVVPIAAFIVQLVYGINAADASRPPRYGMRANTLLLAAILSFNIPVFAKTTPQQRGRADNLGVRGKLITPDHHDADQHVEVRLEKESMQVVQTAYTDGSGSFEFRNLPPGTYFISVNLDGYQPVHQQVDVMNGFGNTAMTIFLTKASPDTSSRASGLDAEDQDVIDISQMKENLPKKAVQEYEKALDEKKKGKLESAIKLLEDAIHMAPNFYHAHNNLGMLYQSLKRYMDAEKEYKR